VFEGHLALRMMDHKERIYGLGSNCDCMKTGGAFIRDSYGSRCLLFYPPLIGGRTEWLYNTTLLRFVLRPRGACISTVLMISWHYNSQIALQL
jgi:hypothetical protein